MNRWIPILLLAAGMSAACSSAVTGSPSQDSDLPRLPPRPRELRIDGFDPCSALTPAQVKSLNVAFYRTVKPGTARGPGCDWIHSPTEPVESYSIDINTRGGVELAFGQPHLNVVMIAGFGAVETPGLLSSGERDCIVNIDVASGQAIQVNYFYNGSTVPMNHEIACRKARNAAELAMQTIQAKIGG
jgi:Protein of unknown function (DUF3558)